MQKHASSEYLAKTTNSFVAVAMGSWRGVNAQLEYLLREAVRFRLGKEPKVKPSPGSP